MERELPKQFDFIDRVKGLMLTWAKENEINLHTIECVVPFVLTDKNLSVWLFYDTDKRIEEYKKNGTSERVKNKYIQLLEEFDYPTDYLKEVFFITDSDENVKNHYEGSYFYRLK